MTQTGKQLHLHVIKIRQCPKEIINFSTFDVQNIWRHMFSEGLCFLRNFLGQCAVEREDR